METPIFQPSVGTSSSSSLGVSPDQDSAEDYHEIRGNIYWNLAVEAATSVFRVPPGCFLIRAPASTQPSRDLKHPMLGHLAIESFRI
jgi:hypothetical protein